MPLPVSLTMILACASQRSIRTSTRPPGSVNLIALERRFQKTCCSRFASPRFGLGRRAHDVELFFDDRVEVERLRFDAQLAAQNARRVEQIFDQFALELGVALDGLERAFVDRVAWSPRP